MKYHVIIDIFTKARQENPDKSTNANSKIKISTILKLLYLPAGIFVHEPIRPYSFAYLVILYILFSFNTLGATVTIDNEKTQPLENLYFVSSGCIVIISLLIGRYHEDYLWRLYQQVEEHQKCVEFSNLANTMIRNRIQQVLAAMFVLICSIIAVPLYAVLFTEAQTDDFIVLIYPMWYPWRRNTWRKYVYSLLFQCMSVLYAYYLLTFVVGSFVCACLFIYILYSILQRRIAVMEEHIIDPDNLEIGFVDQFHRQMRYKFVQIIKDHQDLIRFTRQTVSCFTLLASILVTYATIAGVLLITLFLKTNVGTLLKVKLASTSIVAMISLVACCVCGEFVLNVNRKLMDAIYDKPWYTYTMDLRKLIVMFMIQNQAHFEMRLFNMVPLNVSYIAEAFKLLYTCIQVLRRQNTS